MKKNFNPLPSQKYLIECFDYNSDTGIFIWKERPLHHFKREQTCTAINKQRSGSIAGYIADSGYLMIGIDSIQYRGHRLAWKIITGNDPGYEIDHEDLNRANCIFNNLRSAEGKENARNRKKYSNNKSGYKGVNFHVSYGKFRAKIMKDRVDYMLGYFDNAEDAYAAYCEASIRLHGEFARN
jgi:HNH endonuclease